MKKKKPTTNSVTIKKRRNTKSFRFIKLSTKLMDYMAWKYLDPQRVHKCIHFPGSICLCVHSKIYPYIFEDSLFQYLA